MPGNQRPEERGPTFFSRWEDEFGQLTANGTRNVLDLASQYPFSPERLRLFLNGSRAFPQYNTVSKFTDAEAVYTLHPAGGDTMHIESAESGTYVVNYIMQSSFAFEVNQSLADGDSIRVGPYDGTDGWFLEQRGTDHDDTHVDIIESAGGTETTLVEDAELQRPITEWNRYEARYNWYNVGNQVWTQTYTEDGDQINVEFAKSSNDGVRGPDTGNLTLWQEVTAAGSTTGLELDVGSMGLIVLGDPASLNRDKPQYESITLSGTANAWEPFYAVRIDPDKSEVNVQFTQLDILNYGPNANVEVIVVSVDPSKTDASGWGFSDYHHDSNSALQVTESVSEVPNSSGTQKDLTASEKPGGHTIASAVDIDGGNASGSAATNNTARQEKKSILDSDVAVFLARTGTFGVLDYVWDADQNW